MAGVDLGASARRSPRFFPRALQELGLKRNDKVAIIGSNRPRLYWAMCAAQAFGGVPVPIYADSVAEEMAYILDHAEVTIAVVEDQEQVDKLLSIVERLPRLALIVYDEPRGLRDYDHQRLKWIDDVQKLGRDRLCDGAGGLQRWEAAVAAGSGEDLAIMLYTSGTTGRPKGVMLTFDNLIVSAINGNRFDNLGPDEEVVAYLPLAWVGDHVFSYAQPFTAGFCVNCPESPETVSEDRREIGTTYAFAPPRIYENLITLTMVRMEDAGRLKRHMFHYFIAVARRWGEKILNRERVPLHGRLLYWLGERLVYGPLKNRLGVSRIRLAYTAGEAIGPEIFRFWRALGVNLKQLYGQTEASVYITAQPDGEIYADTVGKPNIGVDIKIDDNGEVLFKSPGVFVGYYKDPQKTAETKTSDGWVHTGDAGLIDAKTGHLKIIDRAKDVGRLNDGALFAPKYIENKLKFYPNIREAVVYGDKRDFVCAMLNIDLTAVGELGRAQQHRLRLLSGAGRAPAGLRHARGACGGGEPVAGGRRHGRRTDSPLSHPAQGTRCRRRRNHAHAEGPPRLRRAALCAFDRGALRRRAGRRHLDRGDVRGRPQGHALRARQNPRRADGAGAGDGSGVRRSERRAFPFPPECQGHRMRAPSGRDIAAGDVLLAVENVSLAFGGIKAITDVSFDIRKGEIRAIIGPNGAGKTSMLNVINGFYHPQQGRITFKGTTAIARCGPTRRRSAASPAPFRTSRCSRA